MSPVEARKLWARRYIAAAPDAAIYGSPEWLALPDGPEKVASVVKAAESYVTELEDALARYREELMHAALVAKRAEDAAYVSQRDAWRHDWTGRGFRHDPDIAADVEREWREWVSA